MPTEKFDRSKKIVITGAAGMVGQNLIILLKQNGYQNLIAIDFNELNLSKLQKLHPDVQCICTNINDTSNWAPHLRDASCLLQLHSQITGLHFEDFQKNNVESTRNLLEACERKNLPFIVHISSSVVNSIADDAYTQTKKSQEILVVNSNVRHCIIRPTLMFGWFDAKHFGWLARFMEKFPIFPIPGQGKFLRQPLYVRDFCRVIQWCMENQPEGKIFDIVGNEEIYYIDVIRTIKRVRNMRTLILKIPYSFFDFLLRAAAMVMKNPPFTSDQLKALSAGDYFTGVNMKKEFGLTPTPFEQAIKETFGSHEYADIVLDRMKVR